MILSQTHPLPNISTEQTVTDDTFFTKTPILVNPKSTGIARTFLEDAHETAAANNPSQDIRLTHNTLKGLLHKHKDVLIRKHQATWRDVFLCAWPDNTALAWTEDKIQRHTPHQTICLMPVVLSVARKEMINHPENLALWAENLLTWSSKRWKSLNLNIAQSKTNLTQGVPARHLNTQPDLQNLLSQMQDSVNTTSAWGTTKGLGTLTNVRAIITTQTLTRELDITGGTLQLEAEGEGECQTILEWTAKHLVQSLTQALPGWTWNPDDPWDVEQATKLKTPWLEPQSHSAHERMSFLDAMKRFTESKMSDQNKEKTAKDTI